MLNRILHISLTNRVAVLLLAVLILIGGMLALMRTEVDIFPDLNAPTVVVMTEAPGFTPEEVERAVTYPIETAVNGATDVRRVSSSSQPGFSVVKIEFDWGVDIYRARQIVSEKISALAADMPAGVGTPTLGPQSSILGEMMIIGLTSDSLSQADLRTIADRSIRPRLLALGGVSSISVIGGDVVEYQVLLDDARMRARDVTLDQVRTALEGFNNNASGGVLYQYSNEYLIKGDIATASVDEMAQAVVATSADGFPVTLADIATVTLGTQEPKLGVASLNATPAVLLTVTKQPATGTIELTDRIDEELASLAKTLPPSLDINTHIFRQAAFISTSISGLQASLLEGAFFVIVVLMLFLMNLRTTLISLVALPLSIIITVLILNLLGMTINTMSLGGIAIAIGSLVDDAIVDVENVYKRLRQNRELPPDKQRGIVHVVYEASKEVRLPIFNSTLIIIACFLPLFFLTGIEGRMLIPLGVAFIVALFASTIVALTVTPVLCSYLLRSGAAPSRPATDPAGEVILASDPWLIRKLKAGYTRSLTAALKRPKPIFIGTAALFVVAVGLFFTLGRSFLPPFNEGSFTINVSTLPGISLDESNRLALEAERIILSMPEISTVARKTGRAELDEHSFGVNVSEIEAPYTLSDRSKQELIRDLRGQLARLPGVNIEIGQPVSHRIDAMLSGTQAQIAVKIFGDDLTRLYAVGSQVKERISDIPGVVDVNLEQLTDRPQLDIRPRRQMLARYGITLREFSDYISTILGSEAVSQVYIDGIPYDVVIKVDPRHRETIDGIKGLLIDSNQGMIPLSYVADVVIADGPGAINREDVSRRIVVSANVDGRDLSDAIADIREAVDTEIQLPEGFHVSYGGQFENEKRASRTLGLTSLLALLIVMLLIHGEFHSWRQTVIILLIMPLAAIGGVIILCLTGGSLNIPAIIGFISLLGITTRTGMLLMSRYNALDRQGVSLRRRLFIGSADRLSPIIMTALTSALALIPLALRGSEPGNEIQAPLAIVILGGLISSTLAGIYIIPMAYALWRNKTTINEDSDTHTHPVADSRDTLGANS